MSKFVPVTVTVVFVFSVTLLLEICVVPSVTFVTEAGSDTTNDDTGDVRIVPHSFTRTVYVVPAAVALDGVGAVIAAVAVLSVMLRVASAVLCTEPDES